MSNQIKISPADIIDRYNNAFGYSAQKIVPRLNQALSKANKSRSGVYLNPSVYDPVDSSFAEMVFTSTAGGEVYQFGIEQRENGTPALPFVKDKPYSLEYLAPPPMISFSRNKYTVITEIDRNGEEVIENFGNQSYRFIMKGIVVDMFSHQYPSDLLKSLHQMFDADGTYKVVSTIFADLDIDEVFFEKGFKIDFVEGYVDTVQYQVTGRAVKAIEFTVE